MITQIIGHTASVPPSNAAVNVSVYVMPKTLDATIKAIISATEHALYAGNFKTISAIINHIIGASAAKNRVLKTSSLS